MNPRGSHGSRVRMHLVSPALTSGAALAIIQLDAPSQADLDAAFDVMHIDPLRVGQCALRSFPGGDRGIVARWTPTHAQLFPHGGRIVLRALREALDQLGFDLEDQRANDPRELYPEARDVFDACALDAIAHAVSPRAIDLILTHRDRWRDSDKWPLPDPVCDNALNRLLRPPMIVLAGPPNIGKSTLTNALARRTVSITSEIPGSTRDHVGVMLELDGLTVSWIDAPGLQKAPATGIERSAQSLAHHAAAQADLVVLAGDATTGIPDPEQLGLKPSGSMLGLGLRADLGPILGCDLACSAKTGDGLADLSKAVRAKLVPDEAIHTDRLWRYHAALPT